MSSIPSRPATVTEGTAPLVRLETHEHVAVLTIDRPAKLNAITVAMDESINSLCDRVNQDPNVRALVLTGAGTRAFTAGSDINDLDNYGDSWQYRNRREAGRDYVNALWHVRVPVIAAINGVCIGGGLELACASDIRVASRESRFGAGEIQWGWHGGSGQTQVLTKLLGPGQASRLLFTGDLIDAGEAYRIGLLQELVASDEVLPRCMALAQHIASRGPLAVQSAKNLIRVAQGTSIETGLAYENDMFTFLMSTQDAAEGRDAFATKRSPRFEGR